MAERIPFKGTFDTSDIISSINRMYAEIKKNNKTPLIDGLEKDIKAIERLQEKISAQKAKGFANQKEFKEYESNLNKLDTAIIKMGQSFEKVNAKNLDIELKQIKDRITELKTETDKLGKNFETSLSKSFTTKLSTDLKTLAKEINEVAKTGADFNVAKGQVKSYYDELIKGAERANLTKAQLKAKDLGQTWMPKVGLQANSFNLNGTEFSKVTELFNHIAQDSKITDKMAEFVAGLKTINVEIKNNATSYDTVKNKFGAFSSALATYTETEINNRNKVNDLIAERDKNIETLEKNAAAYNGIAQKGIQIQNEEANAAQKITAEHQALDSGIKDLTGDLKRYMDVEKQNAALTSVAVEAQDKLNTSLDNLKSRIGYIFSLGNAYYQLRNILKQTLNDVNDIDKAFASIAMVTEKTVNGLWQHYSEYAQLAQKLGQSTESAIKTSALFYQQGLKDAEVMRLTEDTMKLATLAGLDFEKATSQMTAALRGFHMEMENSSHVTDVYSELAAHAAADVNGIAYAMSKTASIANNAGMSFENTAAFLTQMIETTQEAPENIGTAMKTIIARFTELKENVAGTADSEFEDLDYNKVDKALKTVGVSLKDVNGQFRNLDDVFLELSSKWDSLDRNSQRYIATIAAGSRQQSRFIAMMEDYERTMELVTVTENAKGRADEQFAKNAESLQFKLQSLKTAWEQLRLSFANSDFFKNIVDGMTKLVNLLGKMDKGQIAIVATIGIVMGKTIINSLIDTIKKGGTQITEALQESTQKPFMQRGKGAFIKSFSGNFLYYSGITKNLENALGPTSKQNSAFGINTLVNQIAEVDQTNSELDRVSEKLEHIKAVYLEIVSEKNAGKQIDESQLGIASEMGLSLQARKTKLEETLEKQIQTVNKTKEELGYEKEITAEKAKQLNQENQKTSKATPYSTPGLESFKHSEAGKILASGTQTALLTGITTAVTTAISGADFETVVKTTLTTALMSIIPSVISAVGPSIIAALTGPAGIVVIAVAAVVAGIATIVKKSKEAATAEMERLNNVTEANKKLKEDMDEIIADHKKTEAELEKIKKYYEDIKKYSNKSLRTPEEEKRLTEAQEYIKNNYEEAYREYDGHFEIIEFKMDAIIEKMDNTGSAGQLYARYNEQQKNLSDRDTFLNDLADYFNGNNSTTNKSILQILSSNLSWKNLKQGAFKFMDGESEGFVDKLVLDEIQKMYGDMIPQEYLSIFEQGNADRTRIISLIEELTKIEEQQKNITARQGTEEALKLAGWSDETAKIASYMRGAEMSPDIKFADRISNGLVENISGDKWSAFGADADTIKKALASLGYDDPQELFDGGSNLKKWEELTDEMKAALKGIGMSKSAWNGDITQLLAKSGLMGSLIPGDAGHLPGRKIASVENAALSQIIAMQALKTDDLFTKDYKELFEQNQTIFEKYAAAEANYAGLTYKEYERNLNLVTENASTEVQDAIKAYSKEHEDSIKNQWEQASKNLINAGISQNIVDSFAFEASKRFNDILTDASTATKDMIVKYLNSQSLSSQDWNVLGLVDLSSIGLDGAQEYIDQLIKAGHTAEEAQKIFNGYIAAMSQATFSGRYLGAESTGILHEEVKTKIDGLSDQFASITKAQEEMLDKGYISQKTYLQLCKDGFEDYITTTSKGYELIGDKTQEFFVKQAMSAKNYIDQQIVNQQTYMAQAQKYLNNKQLQSVLDYVYAQKTVEDQQRIVNSYTGEFGYMLQAVYSSGAKTVQNYYNELRDGLQALRNESEGAYYDALVAINEQYKTAADKVEELNKELEKLNGELEENNRNVDEAWQKYQEALHGPEFFKSSLDPLINFNNQLSNINDNLDELKDSLKDVDNATNSVGILNNLRSGYDSKAATLQSENVVYNNALANLRNSLLSEYGQYVSFNGDELLVDFSYKQMDANENIIKAYEEQVNAYNDYLSKRKSNDKELKKMNEEREQFEKDYLKKYADAQKDVIGILKDQAAEEVKTQKDKYDALKEADNDYLDALQDAIEKQRKLREQENAEEDLAQKEKRLSLMQRDTSGANAKEVKQLEQEVEQDRESLLDNKIDNIVDDMRELYEKQAEARDAEIEYMEAVTENAQYFNEWARSIVESWESAEDMTTWFLNNDKNAEDLTIEQQELYIADLKEKWTDVVIWQGLQLTDVKANLENIDNQMTDILTNFSEDATSQAEEISAIAHKAAQDEIDEADRAYKAAVKTRQDTLDDIEELHKKIGEAEEVAQLKYGAAMKSMEEASKEAMKNTSVYAVRVLADFLGVDLKDETATKAFAEKQGLINANGQYSQSLIDAVWQSGGDASKYKGTQTYGVYLLPKAGSNSQPSLVESYGTREAAEQAAKKYENAKVMEEVNSGKYGDVSGYIPSSSSNIPIFSTTAVDKDAIAQRSYEKPGNKDFYWDIKLNDGSHRYAEMDDYGYFWGLSQQPNSKIKSIQYWLKQYANGGLVKYTGPAWVDGTPSHPESFLSAEDTQRILDAAEFFAMSPLLNSSMASNDVSSSVGDTSVEININVENIADDYDVDRLIKRVENDINETARPTGTPVILNKRV